MKSLFVLIFGAILFFAGGNVSAQKSPAPEGFLGLKWNSSVAEYARLKDPPPEVLNSNPLASFYDRYTNLIESRGIRLGRRKPLKIGEVDVEVIEYYFRNDRFYMAVAYYNEIKRHRIFKEALILKYGSPDEDSDSMTKWKLGSVWIKLEYRERRGILQYIFTPIIREEEREEKKDAERTKDSL